MMRFTRDTRAGITVPMALLSAMVLVMVGLAVDGSRAFLARDKFQAALDAAVDKDRQVRRFAYLWQ